MKSNRHVKGLTVYRNYFLLIPNCFTLVSHKKISTDKNFTCSICFIASSDTSTRPNRAPRGDEVSSWNSVRDSCAEDILG